MLTRNLTSFPYLGAPLLLLVLAGGVVSSMAPKAHAAGAPSPLPSPLPAPATSAPASSSSTYGVVDLSPAPPSDTQAVAPNIVVTFDDSGSMADDFLGDNRPFDSKSWSGRWECAGVIDPTGTHGDLSSHVMNGVYYNPNVYYAPPVNADGTSFPQADASLKAVDNDGVTARRPYNSQNVSTTDFTGTKGSRDRRWTCLADSTSPLSNSGGPYYYEYTGPSLSSDSNGDPTSGSLSNLYTSGNWTAVSVTDDDLVINGKTIKDADGNTVSQYQNWANWWAYYHTRNLMARTALSRVFGALGKETSDDQYGSNIRVAWQNLNDGNYKLPSSAIISEILDASGCKASSVNPSSTQTGSASTVPDCYRSAFFNWIFQIPASGGTPLRSATIRAGEFFERTNTKNLRDPYWEPGKNGADGSELVCRQNFHMLVTDGMWNNSSKVVGDESLDPGGDGWKDSSSGLVSPVQDTGSYTLPDGTVYDPTAAVSVIYNGPHDQGNGPSLSDIGFHYWAKNLRSDLYSAALADGMKNPVSPYKPDSTIGVTTSGISDTDKASEIYFNPKNDPANWPHLVQYLVGLGVDGKLNFSTDTDCDASDPDASDACYLRKGKIDWPQPNGTQGNASGSGSTPNIDDTWHAAINSRGQFFSAGNPQDLVDQLTGILSNITERSASPNTSAVNASVLTQGALSFNTGYDSTDWSGQLYAVKLNSDGTTDPSPPAPRWDARDDLDNRDLATKPRLVFTSSLGDSTDSVATGMAFAPGSTFDSVEISGLETPALNTSDSDDNPANRVDYLLGNKKYEKDGLYRARNHLLGPIINSQPVYVSYPSSGYFDSWPATTIGGVTTTAPEMAAGVQTYDQFVTEKATRPGTLYVGANDGMLHAFDYSLKDNGDGTFGPDPSDDAGQERWAYVPRAVYANLGNLTSASKFKFAPTVDGTPVTRDVFFAGAWHTILVGGLRLGGRGVYALDITDPTSMTVSDVLWEFDSDVSASSGCVSNVGSCNPDDLGYTYGQPNIGRLANGKWVVLVPTGYYPDCSKNDAPPNCQTLPAAAHQYSALFVLDAQTGEQIAELKTPTTITGVTSYGLSSPVLGDYDNDQVDDVAFAGDLAGNLWRFDLKSSSPGDWSVSLAYKGISDSSGNQGVQPITVMPRLFPDPTTNRFMVVFGTGKYLGASDNTSDSAPTQAIYGIRDKSDSSMIEQSGLEQRYLFETQITDPTDPNYGSTLRGLCSNSDASASNCDNVDSLDPLKGGWRIDLSVPAASGERVVVTPAAIFDSNTAIISTLIPGSTNPCNPTVQGSIMLLEATNGGAGGGVSSIGGYPYVGGRVDNVRTSGTIPVTTTVGGGQVLLPGLTLTGNKKNPDAPFSGDAPIWRRRSWSVINNVR